MNVAWLQHRIYIELYSEKLQGYPFPISLSCCFVFLCLSTYYISKNCWNCPAHLVRETGWNPKWIERESRHSFVFFFTTYYSKWCFPCLLATFKISKNTLLPRTKNLQRFCYFFVPCRLLLIVSYFISQPCSSFSDRFHLVCLSLSLSKRFLRNKKTLCYSYWNEAKVIFQAHPSRDWNFYWEKRSRTNRCGSLDFCWVSSECVPCALRDGWRPNDSSRQ